MEHTGRLSALVVFTTTVGTEGSRATLAVTTFAAQQNRRDIRKSLLD